MKLQAIYVTGPERLLGIWMPREQINRVNSDRAESIRESLDYEAMRASLPQLTQERLRVKAADPDLWARLQLLVLTGTAVETTYDTLGG